ncbi:hypothetical protein [Actomonas aquatica]|uniref:DUF4238 domain-containing protein n=1 Tax=Actomonas aquatica TaxID=2866162 RepID=A0ABZ1CBC2_9BACT|nr:hypothetical protein [Opitutus sp. WL0086]WRQ88685.1 hypothetical protein K1X11_004665 [Opitutus sp. WL0086]
MSEAAPVIAFGQQPCGFFPRRFLVAKVWTARRLQQELGGEIVFFYHDADHDPRETQTTLRHLKTDEPQSFNFTFENKLQRKYSPLYAKRIPADWQENMARSLGAFAPPEAVEAFRAVQADNVADFCLELYRAMGLLEGVRVVRSGDAAVREAACAIDDYYVDVPHEGETVRARLVDGALKLHRGGPAWLELPRCDYAKSQISPARDSRLPWMQSVLGCTHYIAGAGEQAYLRKEDAPEITYVARDEIDRSSEAYAQLPV